MDQKQPLLESDEGFLPPVPEQRLKRNIISLSLAIYSFLVSIVLITTLSSGSQSCDDVSLARPKSIIKADLAQEVQSVHAHPGSVFSGPPSSEHDEAWAGLLRPLFVNVTADELRHVDVDPQHQLRLLEGGFIASLEVYHHLHCIRRLKWHVYESHYFANITDTALTLERNHMNHCIESLRKAIMCTADTSLYTLKWRGEGKRPEPLTLAQRTCTVWQPLEDWALPRALSNSPKLVNPEKLQALHEPEPKVVDLEAS